VADDGGVQGGLGLQPVAGVVGQRWSAAVRRW
jgi:hypothetical protein